jgi:hypothetical protein
MSIPQFNQAHALPDSAPSAPLEQEIQSFSPDALAAVASDIGLNEDHALVLLKHSDLAGDILERISKNASVSKSRKVRLALVAHPKTPRHVSLPMVRHLLTFDLMQIALRPVVPADVKAAADDAICNRVETITSGEKLSLARRASGRVAGQLLLDAEPRVIQTALENPRLTEAQVIKAVMRFDAPLPLVHKVCQHSKWSLRREIRLALLRSQHTPLARALEFARSFRPAVVREILHGSRLPSSLKECLLKSLNS